MKRCSLLALGIYSLSHGIWTSTASPEESESAAEAATPSSSGEYIQDGEWHDQDGAVLRDEDGAVLRDEDGTSIGAVEEEEQSGETNEEHLQELAEQQRKAFESQTHLDPLDRMIPEVRGTCKSVVGPFFTLQLAPPR